MGSAHPVIVALSFLLGLSLFSTTATAQHAFAHTVTVDLSGNGDKPSIQEGIEQCETLGAPCTVLIYPGFYELDDTPAKELIHLDGLQEGITIENVTIEAVGSVKDGINAVLLLTLTGASSIGSAGAAGLQDSTPEIRVRHIAVPHGVALLDWTWSGDAIFSFESSGDDRALKRLRTDGDRLIEDAAWPAPTGHQPIIIGDHELAYFDDQRKLTIIDSRTGKTTRSLELHGAQPIGETGGIGNPVFSDQAIWFHTIHAHSDHPLPRLFRITLDPLALQAFGTGYYPRPGPRSGIYFVDRKDGFSLLRRRPGSDGKLGPPEKVSPLECYAPAPLPGRPLIVIQNGFDPARILLIDDQGRVIRVLSGEAHLSVWPQLSRSGKFVAFTAMDNWEDEARKVHIVDMKGHELHTTSIGDHPVSAAYRWAPRGDRIAIVKTLEGGVKTITVVSVGP